jgi:hypothetical protein
MGIFTYKRFIYRPAQGWRAFPDGGPIKPLADRNYIAALDMGSGAVKILFQEKNDWWQPDQGHFSVVATCGNRALIVQGGQKRKDYLNARKYFWVSLASYGLENLLIEEELARMGLALGYLYLIDESGTLVLVCPPLDYPASKPSWFRNPELTPELLIRRASGTYDRVGPIRDYYGYKDDEVHFWSADNHYQVYDLRTQTVRAGESSEYRSIMLEKPSLDVDLKVLYSNGNKLHIGNKVQGEWHYEVLKLDEDKYFP